DPLSARAAQWLGRDPAGLNGTVPCDIGGLTAARRAGMCASASRYGFHATLKAPMELAPGRSPAELVPAVDAFARSRAPVTIGKLKIAALGGFLALVPVEQSDELTRFAMDCVTAFEPFRAPLDDASRSRRLDAQLSARQAELLEAYGYPYVAEEFRFHMTLTDSLSPTDQTEAWRAAALWFEPLLEQAYTIDRLVLFHEQAPGRPFVRLSDHLTGTMADA